MTEKTSFRDLVDQEPAFPPRCCAVCRYGVRARNAAVMEEIVQCERHPKTPVVMPTAQGPALSYQWPMMRLLEVCGDFEPENDENRVIKD